MVRDSITDDIRAVRHSLAEKHNNNLKLIVADLQRQQSETDRKYVILPKRLPQAVGIAEQNDMPEQD